MTHYVQQLLESVTLAPSLHFVGFFHCPWGVLNSFSIFNLMNLAEVAFSLRTIILDEMAEDLVANQRGNLNMGEEFEYSLSVPIAFGCTLHYVPFGCLS